MDRFIELIGKEREVDDLARHLYQFVSELQLPATGALHLTCSDEAERECTDAFQRAFTEYLLPTLKFGERSHFRLANLGGRYEWGAVGIADDHYSTLHAEKDVKLLVVKVNAHVCVESDKGELRFGRMQRYDTVSTYCGALDALLAGSRMPFAEDLREALCCEGLDRVAVLLDEKRVDPAHRMLFAAVASARMQARRALVDLQDRRPKTPTRFMVLPCVTLNKRRKDGEILCGIYHADWRADEPVIEYQGLGDDPSGYRLTHGSGGIVLEDDELSVRRAARDHRELVVQQWLETSELALDADGDEDAEAGAQLDQVMEDAAGRKHDSLDYAKPMLLMMLHSLAFLDPVTAVALLFGEGLLGMHHCHRAHRLSRRGGSDHEARSVLEEMRARIDTLDPARARQAVDFLHAHLQGRERRRSG
jgi:hypothetical protein